jgi:hypothetical protein
VFRPAGFSKNGTAEYSGTELHIGVFEDVLLAIDTQTLRAVMRT